MVAIIAVDKGRNHQPFAGPNRSRMIRAIDEN